MLPTGHLATGYISARLSLQLLTRFYPQASSEQYLIAGIVCSLLPDLDMLYFFAVNRVLTGGTKNGSNHRLYVSHAPMLHLAIALVWWLAAAALGSRSGELLAIVYFIGTWTHFLFDSFFYGIAWLWPFSSKLFALSSPGKDFQIASQGTVDFWKEFFILYSKNYVFYMELAAIGAALTWIGYS